MLNRHSDEPKPAAPVTLPALTFNQTSFTPIDDTKEKVAKLLEICTIRAGVDAWTAIGRAESFKSWCAIGAALAIGRVYALRVTGANAPMGQTSARPSANGSTSTDLRGCGNQFEA